MNTPIYDFVKGYLDKGTARLHMPGHKGIPFLGCEPLDITEVAGADELYCPQGIILESERNATALFGTRETFYATGGSSQCIGAMLYLALLAHGQSEGRQYILAGRNAHKAFLHTCALLDLDVAWMYPETEESLCSCEIQPARLRKCLEEHKETKPIALYITSPDYLGTMADIPGLSAVCREYGIALLVDNAHGAYLRFLTPSLHPMDLGADLCCDSAHKTLPVLTGGAYLHVARGAGAAYEKMAKRGLALFGSTSPSYLTMQSLDLCNHTLATGYAAEIRRCAAQVQQMAQRLAQAGCMVRQTEPLKLVVEAGRMGMQGFDLAEVLRKQSIEPEFADRQHLVLMLAPLTAEHMLERLEQALMQIQPVGEPYLPEGIVQGAVQQVSIRQAMLSACERIPVEQALGRICAAPAVSCPPAIPIAVSGEVITSQMLALFQSYGIAEVEVLTEML